MRVEVKLTINGITVKAEAESKGLNEYAVNSVMLDAVNKVMRAVEAPEFTRPTTERQS